MRRIGARKDIISRPGVVARRVSVADGFISHYQQVLGGENRNIADLKIGRTAYSWFFREGSSKDGGFKYKVSDFLPVGEVKTKVLYGINRKKDGGSGRGPYQIFEVVLEVILKEL